jgi:uncharacterized protein
MKPPRWLRRHWREALLMLAWLLPILSLLAFGVLWLREKQALLPWLLGTGLLGLAAWPVRRSLRHSLKRRAAEFVAQEARPLPGWGPREVAAHEKVKAVAQAATPLTFTDALAVRDLALQTVRVVATHYHPEAKRPDLAIPVPDALLLAERVARDLRAEILASVPLSRSVTLGTLVRAADAAGKHGSAAKLLYDVADQVWNAVLLFTNPAAGAARLAKGIMSVQIGCALLSSAQSKATRLFVLKVGREAIELYSGRLSNSEADLIVASQRDIGDARHARMAPPRLLLVGQVNAGKSSLVNALAGQVLCEVQTVPTPAGPKEHVLSVEGEECAVLVDMPGLTNGEASRAALARAVERCDMIVWVASAVQPARETDVRALVALREEFDAAAHRRPPLVVALTQIDRLTPASEWAPPYDVVDPSRPKEQAVRAAMAHVAAMLDTAPDAVVPVAMPPGAEPWNTEFLWARIARDLDEAKFRQLERLRLQTGDWRDVMQQVGRAVGRLVDLVPGEG